MSKDRNFDRFSGAQNGIKIGPLHTSKLVTMSMWNNTDVKSVETFSENDKRPDFWNYFGAHIVHIPGSRSNEHIKHD